MKWRKATSIVACLALLITLLPSTGFAASNGYVSGTVTDASTGKAIAGATVTAVGSIGTYTGTTSTKGAYKVAVPAGTYAVTASAAGYTPKTSSVTVKSGATAKLSFKLFQAVATVGTIAGSVTDAAGTAIAGATVRTNVGDYSATTAANGSYSLSSVTPGSYGVSASKDGYEANTKTVSVTAGVTSACDFELVQHLATIVSLTASPSSVTEAADATVALSAAIDGDPGAYVWRQVAGPKVPLQSQSATSAQALVGSLNVAAETELVFELELPGSVERVTIPVAPSDAYPFLGEHVQIGGSSAAVASFVDGGGVEWALFNVGTALRITPVGTTKGAVYAVTLPGVISDIDIAAFNGLTYAICCTGGAGVAVVNVTNPAAMALESCTPVNYLLENVTYTETGGAILTGNTKSSVNAPIVSAATDGLDLFLADAEFGIHKTPLANLLSVPATPVVEVDGTLLVEQEISTVQYAGERAWGGPASLTLYGGKLFAALSELGVAIYDPATLVRVGKYNHYTDEARTEDFFGALAISEAVSSEAGDLFLDDDTGMPDYRQTSYELEVLMQGNNDLTEPTPWADFERRGRFYYTTRTVSVAQQDSRTIAYLANALGGIVAVDVTGFGSATTTDAVAADYLGYFPAVPANGPDETGSDPSSLLPHEGAGMLKESGFVDVDVSGEYVYATDHFAGLVILDDAATPEEWAGPNAPYANDTDGVASNNVPEHEECVSFNMAPHDAADNESLPQAYFEYPCLLATTELNGHGNKFMLKGVPDFGAGSVDVLECSGAGGFVFVDLKSLTAQDMDDRFEILVYFPTTDEIGAYADGTAGQPMAIGHSSGIDASSKYLYVSDGPHGVSAWSLLDDAGFQTDVVKLVGNTIADEYPETINGETIYPPSHTVRNIVDVERGFTWSLCVRNGVRRVPISGIESGLGTLGSPLLMKLARTDIWEHNSDFRVEALNFQDLAYDLAFRGNWAYVADGGNGITIYDVTKDPSQPESGFFVGNLGSDKQKPQFGTASGIELWNDTATGRTYAVLACGPYGAGVADVTDLGTMRLIKVFEPIKWEEEADGTLKLGSADGQAIDVDVIGDKAYFSYDSFGIVCYDMADLIADVPAGVDPMNLFERRKNGTVLYDYRPEELGRFKLQLVPGYEDVDGGAMRLDYTQTADKLFLYCAFGEAGMLKVDFTDSAAPALVSLSDTAAECSDVVVRDGRVYCADGSGGLVFFK